MHRSVVNKLRLPDEGEDMQDFASSVPRIFLPRTSVNKGIREGRGTYVPALRPAHKPWALPNSR